MNIAVVDGQGGGIGRAIVDKVKRAFPDIEVIALGTNSTATGQMLKAGADEGATGENAIIHNMDHVDVVMGVDVYKRQVEELYMNHDWPGNVRELENAVEYGTNMAFGNVITMEEVPARILRKEEEMDRFRNLDRPLAEQVKLYEKEIITKKLKQHNGVKETVAKELGLSRATLYRKLAELDIN